MLGRLNPDVLSIQHQPEAEKELQTWQSECANVDGYKIPNFRPGMRFQAREDSIYLWPDLRPSGEGRVLNQSVESIVSAKEFFSVQTQQTQNYSITTRSRHTAGVGNWGSEMVSVLSTNPPGLKKRIEKATGQKDENYISCRSSSPGNAKYVRDVAFAKMTLLNGVTVNGIVVRESNPFVDYTCGLYRKDKSLIREEVLSSAGTNERIDFYSKDVVNPFRARCHDASSLLSIRITRDLSSGRVLLLNKDEVLAF